MNIGDEVVYNGDYGEILTGTLTAVGSDKDSYNDIKLKDGVFMYKSKKLKKERRKRKQHLSPRSSPHQTQNLPPSILTKEKKKRKEATPPN